MNYIGLARLTTLCCVVCEAPYGIKQIVEAVRSVFLPRVILESHVPWKILYRTPKRQVCMVFQYRQLEDTVRGVVSVLSPETNENTVQDSRGSESDEMLRFQTGQAGGASRVPSRRTAKPGQMRLGDFSLTYSEDGASVQILTATYHGGPLCHSLVQSCPVRERGRLNREGVGFPRPDNRSGADLCSVLW